MKEISKFLLKSLKKEFPNYKLQDSLTSSYLLKNFIEEITQKIVLGEEEYKKATITSSFGSNLIKSDDYNSITQNIQDILDKSIIQSATFNFSISNNNKNLLTQHQNITLYIFYPFLENRPYKDIYNKKLRAFFEKCLFQVYIWLYVASFYRKDSCSQELKIYLYLTDADKLLPSTNDIHHQVVLDENNVNTGFTTPCKLKTDINIYREEEWFKVFIHETFHCFGFDFTNYNNIIEFSKKEILKIFPNFKNINIELYETYCEINAVILNVIFYTHFNNRIDSTSPSNFNKECINMIQLESMFSCFQCVKVLHYNGLKYKDLFNTDKIYKENTNVVCYYILKMILLSNYDNYLDWFYTSNNGSLSFVKTHDNINNFIKLFRSESESKAKDIKTNNKVMLENIKIMEEWFDKNKKREDILSTTMRMTMIE